MTALLSKLETPIQIINLAEIDIDAQKIADKLRKVHETEYEWDHYLLRQNRMEFLKKNLSASVWDTYDSQFWSDYYQAKVADSDLEVLITQLSSEQQQKFYAIRATRKRMVSRFNLSLSEQESTWKVTRIPTGGFSQYNALTANDEQDYRLSERFFKELPDFLDDDDLHKILRSISAMLVNTLDLKPNSLDIIVHHTLVYCFNNETGTNSPEGIHQDGMDYVVSALVIERHNIQGAKSIIYGQDAKTKILELTLHSGQGILQPDDKTDLWHEVTPITCLATKKSGYRASMGFDISVL
jgi:hypothetical protein